MQGRTRSLSVTEVLAEFPWWEQTVSHLLLDLSSLLVAVAVPVRTRMSDFSVARAVDLLHRMLAA